MPQTRTALRRIGCQRRTATIESRSPGAVEELGAVRLELENSSAMLDDQEVVSSEVRRPLDESTTLRKSGVNH
jgi:hypothetical protein